MFSNRRRRVWKRPCPVRHGGVSGGDRASAVDRAAGKPTVDRYSTSSYPLTSGAAWVTLHARYLMLVCSHDHIPCSAPGSGYKSWRITHRANKRSLNPHSDLPSDIRSHAFVSSRVLHASDEVVQHNPPCDARRYVPTLTRCILSELSPYT